MPFSLRDLLQPFSGPLSFNNAAGGSVRKRELRKIVLCLGLELAALIGVPMRPDEIEDLLRSGQQARIEFVCRDDDPDPRDPV